MSELKNKELSLAIVIYGFYAKLILSLCAVMTTQRTEQGRMFFTVYQFFPLGISTDKDYRTKCLFKMVFVACGFT